MYDLFEEAEGHKKAVNPDLTRMARLEASRPSYQDRRRGWHMREADRERERRQRSRIWTPSRPEVIERLDAEGLLPAITFIFSRAACEAAVQQCLYAGLRLNDDAARQWVRALVEERTAAIPPEDLHVLGYYEWLEGLERGIAAHHAGTPPTFKEVVEELFVRGLVKAVFATETLALGINMPARSVVLEKLVKWNGEQHADITPGEYTQLTGRAGRRGIDVEGHAVVLWQRGMNPEHLAGLAGTRTPPDFPIPCRSASRGPTW
ncbi:Helicase OS=Streptomyces fumanus OX=67302 GN=GCM10018772_46600 PE=4 SV=1 [Streptomyces fumanus]